MKDMPKTELFNTFAIQGMELRDYFAAKAMQVFINNPETEWSSDVRDAYVVADKMLMERDKA
jgi:hypothetical protein